MPKIRLLPDSLVSQIAAGEVVERPSSVVKELVENALDAGALEVEVQLEAGGRSRIAVIDDGGGMGREDALLAFDRHATSKIASFEDLERVATLGFRGEALAAIASVARVELTTAELPGEGHRVLIEGGRVRVVEPLARPPGTTVEVRSLFFNVPARRKFLKAASTELRRALEVVQGYALAHPEVRFRVLHEGRVLLDVLAAPGGGGLRERIGHLFGRELAARLLAIGEHGSEGSDGSDRAERISGLIGGPDSARGRRQFVFINRRLVRDRAVLGIFYRTVREEWKSEDYPTLFLLLDLAPEDLDVNVHPQKAEVRFRDPGLLDRLGQALRGGLERARAAVPARLSSPAGLPGAPFAWEGLGGRRPPGGDFSPIPPTPPAPASQVPPTLPSGDSMPAAAAGLADDSKGAWPGPGGWPTRWSAPAGGAGAAASQPGFVAEPVARFATPSASPLSRAVIPLSGRRGEWRPFRLLAQYKGTLILLEGPDGLYLIDQHVAHERILFERLRRSLAAERPAVQTLLEPRLLDLAPAERLRLGELAEGLEPCGFRLASLSGGTLGLTAVPAALTAAEAEALLISLAVSEEGEAAGPATAEGLHRQVLDALAAGLACKSAVKMHHPLSPLEMESLVAELFAAEQPYACPHGRPIVLQMTDSDLERRFGRR